VAVGVEDEAQSSKADKHSGNAQNEFQEVLWQSYIRNEPMEMLTELPPAAHALIPYSPEYPSHEIRTHHPLTQRSAPHVRTI
jgi:hypothetical protein